MPKISEKPTCEELEKRIQELEKAAYEHQQTDLELKRRLEFEQLIARISSELAGSGSKHIDSKINSGLASIGAFTMADRAYIFEFENNTNRADNTYEWCANGIEPQIENLKGISVDEELPWFAKQIRNRQIFHVPEVAALPPEAHQERRHFEGQNIQSLIAVPMEAADRLIGFLGFDAVKKRREWNDDDIALLKFFGQTISHVIERKQVERTLQAQQERQSNIIEGTNAGTWEWNVQTGETIFNERWAEIIGFKLEEISPVSIDTWKKYAHPDDLRACNEMLEKHFNGELNYYGCECRMKHKNGHWVWVIDRGKVISWTDDGKPLWMFGTHIDITKMKELEEKLRQSQKMEAIGTLAGGIAHEFNNILGIIIGNTELAIEDVPKWNPAAEYLQEIQTASLRAKEVVHKILSFVRKTPAVRRPIQIGAIVKESLKLLRATIPTSVEIRQHIDCETETIFADHTELHQVLMNLFANSVHALRERSGIIEVLLKPVALDDLAVSKYEELVPGNYVCLTVKDNGTGIAPEIKDRIFDPYFTTKDVNEGLGMGLTIVYGIVKKNDSAITLESMVGEGTKVEILFPVIKAQAKIDFPAPDDLPKGSERILVVDDEVPLVKILVRILKRLGYEVVGMSSSVEACMLFKAEPEKFDLVITDMAMPQMPGDQLAQTLLAIRPDIPVILCTGYSDRINEKRAGELGFSSYYMKPYQKKGLAEIVRKVLDEVKS